MPNIKILNHACDRFRQRFDAFVNHKEAKDLLRLAYEESVPCPKRLKPKSMQARRGISLRYHKEAGLVLVLRDDRDAAQNNTKSIITCWVAQ